MTGEPVKGLGVPVAVTVKSSVAVTAAPSAGLSMRTDGGASSTVTGTLHPVPELSSASEALTSSSTDVAPPAFIVKVNGAEVSVVQL